MKLARAAALLSLAGVLAACAPRAAPPKREVVSLPPNTEVTGKYWITCKAGFTTERGVEGCVPVAKSGENPTTVVEIPNSSGRWGADISRERERKGSRGSCCADHGGSLGCLGGVAVCADGSVGQGCDCGEGGLDGLGGLEGLIPSE